MQNQFLLIPINPIFPFGSGVAILSAKQVPHPVPVHPKQVFNGAAERVGYLLQGFKFWVS